jgi:hypothetical protein
LAQLLQKVIKPERSNVDLGRGLHSKAYWAAPLASNIAVFRFVPDDQTLCAVCSFLFGNRISALCLCIIR